ncbi:MAG: NUDIX hydrolase [Anderseniella sp.]|jgi:8-oxo-dGTP pyrophosphatase MutT (NUDIX family)|nr:NUDIX hydrolase [Anderseniella sp.]
MSEPVDISGYELPLTDAPWAWADDNAAAIKRFWNKAHAEKPSMFNGQVLVMAGHELRDSVLAGNVLRTDFASFLYWKDRGLPDEAGVRNVFGCAVVRSGDGHLLFGRMAAHTAGSGRVYPMAGTPDPEDVTDGKLDVEGSIIRELMEEAGLDAAQATRTPGYLLVEDGRMCSLNAVFTFDAPSRELKARMMQHIETQESSELDEIVVFRRAAFHVHHRMPGFARALVQHLLD